MEDYREMIDGDLTSILKSVSRTLYLSINILPAKVRALMAMGYLLCRALDTVTDCQGPDNALKREILAISRRLGDKKYHPELVEKIKRVAAFVPGTGEKKLLLNFNKLLSVYLSFPAADRLMLDFVCDGVAHGMEMDVETFAGPGLASFKTEEELRKYCGYIGGAPGVFWARLYRDTIRQNNALAVKFPSEDSANALGSALQIINILKDMSADLKCGRCYLPQSDLSAVNMKPEDLLDPANMKRLKGTVYKWVAWALDQLDTSESFVSSIPKTELSLRAAVIWPVYWGMDTLEKIAVANLLDPAGRPRIKRNRIYTTILSTPPLLLSNTAFSMGYRFRRETLMVALNTVIR